MQEAVTTSAASFHLSLFDWKPSVEYFKDGLSKQSVYTLLMSILTCATHGVISDVGGCSSRCPFPNPPAVSNLCARITTPSYE